MEIGKEKILNLANQIYLGLDEQDVEKLSKQIGDIVEETKILDEIDVSDIKPDISVLNYNNVFRPDVVEEWEDKQSLLQNAKETHDDMFKIPKILN